MPLIQLTKIQIIKTIPILGKLYLPVLGFLGVIVIAAFKTQIPLSNFTRDPTAVAGIQPFTGIVSNLGVLAWCATATICFTGAYVARKTMSKKTQSGFFLFSGIITAALMIDDLFLFHETVFPDMLHIRQEFVYALYMILISIYLVRFRKTILNTDFGLLLSAFFFFGLSILVDLSPFHQAFLVEDSFKLLGIVTWAAYLFKTSFLTLSPGKDTVPMETPSVQRSMGHQTQSPPVITMDETEFHPVWIPCRKISDKTGTDRHLTNNTEANSGHI